MKRQKTIRPLHLSLATIRALDARKLDGLVGGMRKKNDTADNTCAHNCGPNYTILC